MLEAKKVYSYYDLSYRFYSSKSFNNCSSVTHFCCLFYFSRKNKHTDRDKSDWEGMRKFFEMESHLGYPFNKLTEEQWGVKYI